MNGNIIAIRVINVPKYYVKVLRVDNTLSVRSLTNDNEVRVSSSHGNGVEVMVMSTSYDNGVLVIVDGANETAGITAFKDLDVVEFSTLDVTTLPIVEIPLVTIVNAPFNTAGSMVDDNGIDVTSEVTIITTSGSKVSTTSVTGVFNLNTPDAPYYAISDDGNSVRILERQGTISDLPLDFVMESTTAGLQYNAEGFVYDVEGNPLGQTVVITATGEEPTVLGVGVSDPTTGAYLISVGSWSGEVMAYTHQNYGIEFSGNVDVLANSVVHPTTPNQYVYKIITPGKLPTVEPVWPTEIRVFDLGTATAEPVKLLEPQMAGWFKVKAV